MKGEILSIETTQKIANLEKDNKIYKSRIDKANDYINSTDFIYDEQYKKKDKLENILNGGDDE